jgi:hypothetical protein
MGTNCSYLSFFIRVISEIRDKKTVFSIVGCAMSRCVDSWLKNSPAKKKY